MRFLLALIIAALAACRSNFDVLEDQFRNARNLLRSERYDLALLMAEDGLRRAERTRNPSFEWRFRLLKVEVLLGKRSPKPALELLDSYGDPPSGAEWLEDRGRAFLLRGFALSLTNSFSEAQDYLSRAAEAAHLAGAASLLAEVELRRGAVLVRKGQTDEARRVFETVIEASARLHDRYLEANALGNYGRSLQTDSRYDEALPWFERADSLFNAAGANESMARVSENIGYCYFRLGDYDNARAYFEQAQKVFARTNNDYEQQLVIGNTGNVDYEAGDYRAAESAYKSALEIARRIDNSRAIADWLGNLGTISMELGDWDAAEKYNNEALDRTRRLEDRRSEPNLLINVGRIAVSRNRLDEAQASFRSALSARTEDPSVPLDAHAGLADLSIRKGQSAQAEREFNQTIADIDRRTSGLLRDEYKMSYASSLIRFYGKYVDFLIASKRPARALEIAESSRSRVLAERTGGAEAVHSHTSQDYKRLAGQAHAVLLEYWLGQTQSYLWVITPHRVQYHVLPGKGELHSLIESYRAVTMRQRNPLKVAAEIGQKLYQDLLAPIADDAPKADRFIIVPDGDLHAFNLESLPAGKDNSKFWVERATVSIAPSLNYLTSHHPVSHPHSREGLLTIGDVPAVAEYPRLEYAGREMDSITAAMGGSQQLRDSKATPESYRTIQPEQFSFIHFSSHAIANQVSPLDSAVILSGAPDKFRLFAREVVRIPLTAELVTISACQSAGAKTYAGEGLVGFTWAFLKAGAENVIAGLWDVSDRSTAQLMTGLYTGIAAGSPLPDALRASKLVLIRAGGAYAKPFYWAPFELYTGTLRNSPANRSLSVAAR